MFLAVQRLGIFARGVAMDLKCRVCKEGMRRYNGICGKCYHILEQNCVIFCLKCCVYRESLFGGITGGYSCHGCEKVMR